MSVPRTRAVLMMLSAFALSAHNVLAVPQENQARIHGRVETESGAPIRGAAVTLTMPGVNAWTASTDDDGRFEVRGVPAGAYQLRVAKTGFLPPASYETVSILRNTGDTDLGPIVMRRAAAIAGRVVDETGEPIVAVMVSASRLVYSPPGTRTIRPVTFAATNDLGEYRLFGLEPGAYYVGASSRTASADLALQRAEQRVLFIPPEQPRGFAPTYFPSARHETDAQAIRVAAGENRLGVDIRLANQPLVRISGRVRMSDGTAAVGAYLVLATAGNRDVDMSSRRSATISTDGSFSIVGVIPGQYTLSAYSRDYLNQASQAVRSLESWTMALNVAADVSGIEIHLSEGFGIRGRVVVDGVPQSVAGAQLSIGVARYENASEPSLPPVAIQASGDFLIRNVAAGRVRLVVANLPARVMISRMTLNGIDITDEGFELSAHVSGIDVSITTNSAVLAGVVTTVNRERALSHVIVFSEDSRYWTLPGTRYLHLMSTTNGEFKTWRVPPGRYFAAAVPTVDPMTWADPENLAQLRKLATAFTVPESGLVTLNLVMR